jgi:MFS family permease
MKPNKPPKKKRTGIAQAKFGAILTLIAIALGSAPAIIGYVMALMTSTPGDGGGWGLMVFMLTIITGPIGAVVALIGLVILLTGFVRVIRAPIPAEGAPERGEALGDRAIAFALLSIPFLVVQTVVNFIFGHMNLGQGILVPIVVSTALVITALAVAIRYGIQSQQQKLRLCVFRAASFSMLLAVGLGVFWYVTFMFFHNA